MSLPKILIVGGGAAGLELAAKLGRKFGKKHKAMITLVDSSPIHLWKPLLHEAAAGTLLSHEDEINFQSFASTHFFQFHLGTMQGLNRAKKQIQLKSVWDDQNVLILPERTLDYDVLIMAVGSTANDFTTPGVKEHCYFLDNRDQAIFFQQQFLKQMLRLAYEEKQSPGHQFKIAIIGGGATGVELAAELQYAIKLMTNSGLSVPDNAISISIIEAAERILPALPARIASFVTRKLTQQNIKILTQKRVLKIEKNDIIISSDQVIPADMIVWSAGIKAPEFLRHLDGLAVNQLNQLIVKPTLQTTIDEHIFALGDCAACPQNDESIVPPRAQAAQQQANFLAKYLINYLQHKPMPRFQYQDRGSLISLGQHDTIGHFINLLTKNFIIEGALARLAYRSLYKMHQAALFGSWQVSLLTLANRLSRGLRPRVKLH